MNEPTKTEVTAEDWLKATALELCKVADHFIALRKDAERVDAAAVELMDSTAKLEQENAELQARVKRLEDMFSYAVNGASDAFDKAGIKPGEFVDRAKAAADRIKRLEEALGLVLKMRNDWFEMQDQGQAGAYYAFVKGSDDAWDAVVKAKESKP